jgi:two-component system nitrate/nitrite response regulator NarL
MTKSFVCVLLVDDFQSFREFVRSLLQQRPDFVLVGEVSDGLEAVKRAKELQPELLLLDIGLPRLNGFEAARQIRCVAPATKIVFVTLQSTPEAIREAFRIGARGYILKSDANEILKAIDSILGGERFLSSSLMALHPELTDIS